MPRQFRQQRATIELRQLDVQIVGKPQVGLEGGAIESQARHRVCKPLPEAVPQGGDGSRNSRQASDRTLTGLPHTDNARHVECAAPQPPLLPTSKNLGVKPHEPLAAADVERPHTFGTVALVPGETCQVRTNRIDIDRTIANGLSAVDMQQRPAVMHNRRDVGQRLQHTNLVVGQHHGNEHRLLIDRCGQLLAIDEPRAVRSL